MKHRETWIFSIGRIDNIFLYVNEQGQGIGTNLFLNQFQAARQHGFKRIHVTAMAPFDDEPHWTGYYFWACLGFENEDIEDFQDWAAEMGREEPSLSALVQSETGRELWKMTGFTWNGNFFLSDGHVCIQNMKMHLEQKGINFPIG